MPRKASRRRSFRFCDQSILAVAVLAVTITSIFYSVFPFSSCNHPLDSDVRDRLFWADPVSHTCTSYGTREYSALLVNVPEGYKLRVEACMATPIKIHGVEYKPKWCEDHVGVPLYGFRTGS